jgi:hypothetical protein
MVVWTRVLEKIALRAKNGFMFASGKTDTELMHILDKLCAGRRFKFMDSDFVEFDTAQNNLEHALFMYCLTKMGCPPELRSHFLTMMEKRTVLYDHATVEVQNKKDSGRVDTLIGNTLFNAAVVLSCVNYLEITYAIFKGDDCTLMGKEIVLNNDRIKRLGIDCGYQLKISTGDSGEFTSFILNDNGCALNIPKIAAKTLSRSYANQLEFNKYKIAVQDLIKTTNSTNVAANMSQVNEAHFRVNREKFDLLLSFLHMFARGEIKFTELVSYEARVKTEGM